MKKLQYKNRIGCIVLGVCVRGKRIRCMVGNYKVYWLEFTYRVQAMRVRLWGNHCIVRYNGGDLRNRV